jgi:putative secretion ATPase (PEP-CTERM system associated)
MYENFFGFSARPFQLMPDTRFFFKSAGHQRALAYMRYGLQQGQGFIVITGDVGTGKSLLLNALVNEMDTERLVPVRITSSRLDHEQVLKVIAGALGLDYEGRDKAALLHDIETACQAVTAAGKRVIVLVDEAQNLPTDGLEELRMLSNVEHCGQPILQCFLLGQREFRHTLRAPGLEQLRQRVIAAYHLRPLSESETRQYIQHRLKTVGWRDDPRIEEPVYALITAATLGIPRRINLLMDRLLLNCGLDELHYIDEERTRTVIREVELEVGSGTLPADEEEGEGELAPGVHATEGAPPAAAAAPRPGADAARLEAELAAVKAQLQVLMERNEHLARELAARTEPVVAPEPTAVPRIGPISPADATVVDHPSLLQAEATQDDIAEVRRSARRWQAALVVGAVVVLAGAGAAIWVLQDRL